MSLLVLLREISARHWARAPVRSLLIVLGIALGVALYVATEAAADSMFAAFGELVTRVANRADLTIQAGSVGIAGERVADVAEVPGVAHAAATLEVTTQATDFHESLLVLGVDLLGDTHFLPFDVKEGEERVVEDPLKFVNEPNAILVARRFAHRHGLVEGKTLRLMTAEGQKPFVVRGILEDTGPASSFGGQVAVMFIDAAQISFARGTFVDRIDVALAKGADAAGVRTRLRAALGAGVKIENPDQLGSRLKELIGPLHGALRLSGLVALMVGAFVVYNAVGVAVAQRTREIGLLRALGVTRNGAATLLCFESAVLALPGVAVGLVAAKALARRSTHQALEAVNRLLFSVVTVEPRLTTQLAVRAVFAGLATSVLAALWPARRGASIEPATVLRGASSVERSTPPYALMLGGAVLLVGASQLPFLGNSVSGGAAALIAVVLGAALATPALVLALRRVFVSPAEWVLGVPGRLGLDYVERTLGRSSVNVLALMVAVSMSVSVGGWLVSFEHSLSEWFDRVSADDLSVTAGSPLLDRSHVPMNGDVVDRVRAVPGVRAVQAYRIVEQDVEGQPFSLTATDTDTFLAEARRVGKGWPLMQGANLEPGELSGKPRVLVSDSAARKLHLKVGQDFVFQTPKGEAHFEVRGIILDYASMAGSGFIDRKVFVQYWGDPSVDTVSVYLQKGASAERVSDAIRAALGQSTVFVTTTSQVHARLLESLSETFSYSRSVEWITLFIALLGVVGTMIAAVIDRTREIATLRAIGATPRQVAAAIVVEAGFLGFCAVVAGVFLGIAECLLFLKILVVADTGWSLDFVFPWASTLRIASLAIVTSMIAGGIAAVRAARTDVVGSVVYE